MDIDLNQPLVNHEFHHEGVLPNPIIDLNQPPINHELHDGGGELDLSHLNEDDNEISSDSSDEEIGEQTRDTDYGRQTGDTDDSQQGNVRGRRKRELTNVERWAIYCALLEKSVNGKLKKNTTKEVKDIFNVESLRTVQRIWRIHKRTPSGMDVDVSSRKTRNCGRK